MNREIKMIQYKTLENTEWSTIYNAFLNAFSDYQVSMNMSLQSFEELLKRRGYKPEFSIAAFFEKELVGFVLNGIRNYNDKIMAYDISTGVVIEHRRKGLTTRMLSEVKYLLKENNVNQYLLEVLQANTRAYDLYLKSGFTVNRELLYYRKDKDIEDLELKNNIVYKKELSEEQLKLFWDFTPSWQNSVQSIMEVSDSFTYATYSINNNIVGYGVVHKHTGDIPLIAVNPNHRRKRIGTELLSALIDDTESKTISVANVEKTNEETIMFLESLGFAYVVSQFEMIYKL